jgi:acyl-[acyl-carrier-protein]-phospholipid O-acyltransferase/long-chain-fatty-acid--[acyl-carrier-protein] ligase
MPETINHNMSVQDLSALPEHWESLGHAFLHQARTQPHAIAIRDSSGISMTYHDTLLRSIALANILHKRLGKTELVGVLLPPSAGAALVNIALTLLGKVPVNLNYTSSQNTFNQYLSLCDFDHIVTSRRIIERFPFDSTARYLPIERLRQDASLLLKAVSWSEADLVPEGLLGHMLAGLKKTEGKLDETATLLFTAGSTGDAKGVLLSHRNILSNVHAIQQQARLSNREVVLGVVPFFHSFGFTLTLWAVLALGHTAIYHYDPRDCRRIGNLCERFRPTVMFCTPTIMRAYLKRSKKEQFESIRICILGGEKVKPALAQDIERELGIIATEGYGLTETAPVIACNIPGKVVLRDGREIDGTRVGTVGLPLPGTTIRILGLENGLEKKPFEEGSIEVKGPQVMKGYFHNEEATRAVMHDGWFRTGDLGFLDNDGFLTISGRMSQFSKIGGEMVPHLQVEREIVHVAGCEEQNVSVTSVPDDNRGEKIVVVHTKLPKTPEEIVSELKAENVIPTLWVPDAKDFVEVDELPVLTTGKLDLCQIRKIAGSRVFSP